MTEVVKVKFKNNGQTYLFDINGLTPKINDKVIVESERGKFVAVVSSKIIKIDEKIMEIPIKKIIKLATNKDVKINEKNERDANEALKKCRELSNKLNVNINPTQAEYTFDKDKLIINFVSEKRVDFRELARALAGQYRTRIELRQIGVRDKAKEVGGIGSCGRQLCCKLYLKQFDSVSINMAKNQSIALNPNKINGACGRLLCCLKYENENYTENKKKLPKCGTKLKENIKVATVIKINYLTGKYIVEYENKEQEIKDIYECN